MTDRAKMQIGMIGLGRMGANLVRRLQRDGHECVVYDLDSKAVAALAEEGAAPTYSLAELVAALRPPRTAWIMVPAAFVDVTVDALVPLLEAGDIVIDGGNSFYRDDVARAERLAAANIHYVDIGTSGGVFGLDRGFCLMIGGEPDVVADLDPILATIAPGAAAAPRTPGRDGALTTAEQGYLHCGPAREPATSSRWSTTASNTGSWPPTREGLAILDRADAGTETRDVGAETAPLLNANSYQYAIDTTEVAEVWRRGSVIGSWLLDLTAAVLHKDPELGGLSGRVSDSGEGRWTVQAAVDLGVPAHVLTAALYERFSSRGESAFADRVLSAMRREFGGHAEKTEP